jgi:hypothetical protein
VSFALRQGAQAVHVTEYALFPTRLLAIQFPEVAGLNRDLHGLFATRPEFRHDFNMHPDALNLLRLADVCPALAQLRRMFLDGLRRWLGAEGAACPGVEVVLFSNYAARGDFTLVHNHNADVAGVYYVRTPEHDRPAVFVPGPDSTDDYFVAEDGALVLHDPRFNANLAAVGVRDYAKVFPRPGLMVLFPGYLWHSVTPLLSEGRRLAISANFRLRWGGQDNAEFCPLSPEEG